MKILPKILYLLIFVTFGKANDSAGDQNNLITEKMKKDLGLPSMKNTSDEQQIAINSLIERVDKLEDPGKDNYFLPIDTYKQRNCY